jgi:hypothetical protein
MRAYLTALRTPRAPAVQQPHGRRRPVAILLLRTRIYADRIARRVYKGELSMCMLAADADSARAVKQELFMADVQTCFTSLKKAVLDFQTRPDAVLTELQMGQPTGRYARLAFRPSKCLTLSAGVTLSRCMPTRERPSRSSLAWTRSLLCVYAIRKRLLALTRLQDWDELLLRQQGISFFLPSRPGLTGCSRRPACFRRRRQRRVRCSAAGSSRTRPRPRSRSFAVAG